MPGRTLALAALAILAGGVVGAIHVAAGDLVEEGATLLDFEVRGA